MIESLNVQMNIFLKNTENVLFKFLYTQTVLSSLRLSNVFIVINPMENHKI